MKTTRRTLIRRLVAACAIFPAFQMKLEAARSAPSSPKDAMRSAKGRSTCRHEDPSESDEDRPIDSVVIEGDTEYHFDTYGRIVCSITRDRPGSSSYRTYMVYG